MTTAPQNTVARVAQVAMLLNAALHGIASVGMAAGIGRHAAEQLLMGRRAAAAGIAAVVMFVFVARRLRRDPALVALPLAFVLGNLIATIGDFLSTRETAALGPAVPETAFLVIYAAFALRALRGRAVADTAGGVSPS